MSNVRFVPQRVPLVDLRSGQMTREWFLFFQAFFDPQAGSDETTVVLSVNGSSGVSGETTAIINSVSDAGNQLPPPLPYITPDDSQPDTASIRDELAELRKAINDLKQGIPVL